MERTIETIHKEYSDLCARAGHTQYQIEALKIDLNALNEKLRVLNLEAAALAKASEAKSNE